MVKIFRRTAALLWLIKVTGPLMDMPTRGLVKSRMLPPTAALSCYVSVGIVQIIKRLLSILCSVVLWV